MSVQQVKSAGILLVAGWAAFWVGAFIPPWRWWYPIPTHEYLGLVLAHRWAWLAIAGLFAVGVLLTIAGLVVLGPVLRSAGDRVWSELGQAALLFGSVLWIASIAFRATATVAAAHQAVDTGVVPMWFEPLRGWSTALFAVYMVLAYLAIAAYGKALLGTALVPRWLARTHIVFGLIGAVGFAARVPIFDPPLMIHLVPGILGAYLLWGLRGG